MHFIWIILEKLMRKSLYFWTFLFIYYFLYNLQFHNSRAVYNKGSQEGYTNLVTNIVKLHAAQAGASEHLNTLVIKPIFKCTPQIKIIKERYVKKIYLKIIWKSFFTHDRFPRSKHVFLYRNISETVSSFMRVLAAFQRLAAR